VASLFYFALLGLQSIVIRLFVCLSVHLSVCLFVRSHNSKTKPCIQTSPNFMHVALGHGSVLLWWWCNMLCTSGFMDDVMLSFRGTCRWMDGHGVVY